MHDDDQPRRAHTSRAHVAELLSERRIAVANDIVARLRRGDVAGVSPLDRAHAGRRARVRRSRRARPTTSSIGRGWCATRIPRRSSRRRSRRRARSSKSSRTRSTATWRRSSSSWKSSKRARRAGSASTLPPPARREDSALDRDREPARDAERARRSDVHPLARDGRMGPAHRDADGPRAGRHGAHRQSRDPPRHRQDSRAGRYPVQAVDARRRRVGDHEAPRRGGRGDSVGDPRARAIRADRRDASRAVSTGAVIRTACAGTTSRWSRGWCPSPTPSMRW